MNILKKWRERRQQKRKQRETQQTLQMWALLEKLFDAGQISFDRKAHRLFITQPVASLLMSKGADAWVQSVHNIYNYVHFLQTQQAWDEYMQKEELAAVRDAMQAAKEHQPSALSHQPSYLSGTGHPGYGALCPRRLSLPGRCPCGDRVQGHCRRRASGASCRTHRPDTIPLAAG